MDSETKPESNLNKIEKAEEKALKTSTSKGEKLFDLLTYVGIAGIGTFLLTIPVAYSAKYGKGAKYYEKTSKFLVDKGISPRLAEDIVMTSATMQGGNLSIIPVKMMEDNKPEIVDKLNKMTGDESGKASVDEDLKQTWGSLVKSRILAWVAAFTGFRTAVGVLGAEKFVSFENAFAKKMCEIVKKPTHLKGVETPHYRYAKIGALDVFATIAATTILYTGSRFFAKRNEHWHEKETLHMPSKVPDMQTPEYIPSETSKRFTDNIRSQSRELAPNPREKNYADTIASQKTINQGKATAILA